LNGKKNEALTKTAVLNNARKQLPKRKGTSFIRNFEEFELLHNKVNIRNVRNNLENECTPA